MQLAIAAGARHDRRMTSGRLLFIRRPTLRRDYGAVHVGVRDGQSRRKAQDGI
jgi:hypothetical protein